MPLQVIDEVKGPVTKKEFELFEVAVGENLFGHVVNFLGQPLPGLPATSQPQQPAQQQPKPTIADRDRVKSPTSSRTRPLLASQVRHVM